MLRRRLSCCLAVPAFALALAWPPPPAAAAAPSGQLVFAEYNVCKATCDAPAPAWDQRRDAVVATIASAAPDVVALLEATNQPVGTRTVTDARGRTRTVPLTQYQDLVDRLAPAGYAAPEHTGPSCSADLECVHTARILYRSSVLAPVPFASPLASAGDATLSQVAPSLSPLSASRQLAWAYLTSPATGPFLVLAAHLTNDKSATGEADRLAFAASLDAWVASLNAARGLDARLPVVLLADLNSYAARQPRGAQQVLAAAGWQDAVAAPIRRAVAFNTVNYTRTQRSGWPSSPPRAPSGAASRIDYVLYRGPGVRAVSYEVFLRLDAHGRFLPAFHGSDHNLVRATLAFMP